MFIKLVLINISIVLSYVNSFCYMKNKYIWICDNDQQIQINSVLNQDDIQEIIVKHSRLNHFQIDQYSPTLRWVTVNQNEIQTISITRTNRVVSNIRRMNFQSNQLRYFNSTTVSLPISLQSLSLAFNQLEILDGRLFFSLTNLTKLDLRNNRLKRILLELFIGRNIQLNNNPMDYQCSSDYYRILSNVNCSLPSYSVESQRKSYVRLSTITLTCPIKAYPPPIIIWSTPFGKLAAINSSDIDLLLFDSHEPIYSKLTVLSGPLTARTKHILHALNSNQLTITRVRAGLQTSISCMGINILGNMTYKHEFIVENFIQKHAIWNMIYTLSFGIVLSLIAGLLCTIVPRTWYYSHKHLKTPPIYPTMTPNSAARTPPNFELNQWLSIAAANISGTLEQVRDKLRIGVQHVSEHMGRASELFTTSVHYAGTYFQSIRETGQQRLNTIRVQTVSSLRNPSQIMRAGMNMLTTQVNSLRDYCGVITVQQPVPLTDNSPISVACLDTHRKSFIDELNFVSRHRDHSPYAGDLQSDIEMNTAGVGQLDSADNSILTALDNFQEISLTTEGQLTSGIGIFHSQQDDLVDEPHRLIIYGEQYSSV